MSKSMKNARADQKDAVDELLELDLRGLPYVPPSQMSSGSLVGSRGINPVVFLEFSTIGGRGLPSGGQPSILGRLYFELRRDLLPVTCTNFLSLCMGTRGFGEDGVMYSFKGTKIHRVVKDVLFQAGDLMGLDGLCSRSIYNNGGLFRDENFLLRHTGPGCLSMVNRGPDSNGSLFQVVFAHTPTLDERCVVFGCLANDESYDILLKINALGSDTGKVAEEIRISDCGLAFEANG